MRNSPSLQLPCPCPALCTGLPEEIPHMPAFPLLAADLQQLWCNGETLYYHSVIILVVLLEISHFRENTSGAELSTVGKGVTVGGVTLQNNDVTFVSLGFSFSYLTSGMLASLYLCPNCSSSPSHKRDCIQLSLCHPSEPFLKRFTWCLCISGPIHSFIAFTEHLLCTRHCPSN